MPLLEVKNLKMYYSSRRGLVRAVDDVSLSIEGGRTVGLVGESGCGKSSFAYSIMRILPPNGRFIDGQILLEREDLLNLTEEKMRKVRWKEISMIFQSAMNALNPVIRVGDQLVDVLRAHESISRDDAKKKVAEVFELVEIPASRVKSYPHEFSGGMNQRAIIAMSLLCGPKIIIADEPTTALDVVVQDQIMDGMKQLQKKYGVSMILISHDVSVIAENCDRVAVMYGGQIVEHASTTTVFKDPRHPYTIALLNAFPSVKGPMRRLTSLRGSPPNLLNLPPGCRFAPRCPIAEEVCRKEAPRYIEVYKEHYSRCHFASRSLVKEVQFKLENQT